MLKLDFIRIENIKDFLILREGKEYVVFVSKGGIRRDGFYFFLYFRDLSIFYVILFIFNVMS